LPIWSSRRGVLQHQFREPQVERLVLTLERLVLTLERLVLTLERLVLTLER